MAVGKFGIYYLYLFTYYLSSKFFVEAKKHETLIVGIFLLLLFHEIHVFSHDYRRSDFIS